jgi:uncharacterized protein
MIKERLIKGISSKKDLLNLTLNITERCNLRCRYCYIDKGKKTMSWKIAKQAVNFALSLAYKSITISFVTAEPLLEWDLIKKIIKYSERKGIKRFDLGTNGTLLNREILEYFQEHNIIPMISIDGKKKIQDINRAYKNGKGSFNILDKKLNLIRKYFNRRIEIRITFTPETISCLSETILYLKKKGLTNNARINISPAITKQKWKKQDFRIFKEQLFKIADIFIESYKENKPINICNSECFPMNFTFLNLLKNKAQLCCGRNTINISIDGKIYPCYFLSSVRYKKKEKLCCGNIWEGISSPNILREFQGINPDMSCFAWNYIINNDFNRPINVYRKFYNLWLSTSQYVINAIKK